MVGRSFYFVLPMLTLGEINKIKRVGNWVVGGNKYWVLGVGEGVGRLRDEGAGVEEHAGVRPTQRLGENNREHLLLESRS